MQQAIITAKNQSDLVVIIKHLQIGIHNNYEQNEEDESISLFQPTGMMMRASKRHGLVLNSLSIDVNAFNIEENKIVINYYGTVSNMVFDKFVGTIKNGILIGDSILNLIESSQVSYK